MPRYIDADKLAEYITENYCKKCDIYNGEICCSCPMNDALIYIDTFPAADVVPKSEVAMEIFEKLKRRECSNSVCAWCIRANAYGRRNEECDKPYIDKNGKEQKACYAYAKFESLIDKELAELKKKYTEV